MLTFCDDLFLLLLKLISGFYWSLVLLVIALVGLNRLVSGKLRQNLGRGLVEL